MSAVVATPAAMVAPASSLEKDTAPKQYANIKPSSTLSAHMGSSTRLPRSTPRSHASPDSQAERSSPPASHASADGKASPRALRAPMIKVKKEPGSPNLSSSTRHRPRRLDLSSSTPASRGPQTAGPSAPLTARDSAGLAIKDLGVACLSPGFQTHDPAMREQLQRSLDVREQQRQLIEARQKGSVKAIVQDGSEAGPHATELPLFESFDRAPMSSTRRKGPPPGLSIHAPSAASFANERVIQSAPIHNSFTGLRHHQPSHQPSNLGHIHHVPATQTANRLPPIADVFAADLAAPPSASLRPRYTGASPSIPPPLHSPSYPPPHHQSAVPPLSSRGSEFRSAEEAVAGLSGGRDDLLPKIVHYGGVQPPTPPSPMPNHYQQQSQTQPSQQYTLPPYHQQAPPANHYDARPESARAASFSARRRTRDEFEHENESPAGYQSGTKRFAQEEEDWRANLSGREKREEFLRLCERAWDLFHS